VYGHSSFTRVLCSLYAFQLILIEIQHQTPISLSTLNFCGIKNESSSKISSTADGMGLAGEVRERL
jgi:hypothetical protein